MILVPFYTLWRFKGCPGEEEAHVAEDFVLFRVKVVMSTTSYFLYSLTLDHGPKTSYACNTTW